MAIGTLRAPGPRSNLGSACLNPAGRLTLHHPVVPRGCVARVPCWAHSAPALVPAANGCPGGWLSAVPISRSAYTLPLLTLSAHTLPAPRKPTCRKEGNFLAVSLAFMSHKVYGDVGNN